MNSSAFLRQICRRLGMPLGILPLLTACTLLKTSTASQRSAGGTTLIVTNSIFMDRVGSGDTARVQFQTTANAVCQIAYYAQDATKTPTAAQPTVIPCSNQNLPRQVFIETIPGLRKDTLYYLNIFTWIPPAPQTSAGYLTVRETNDTPTLISGDPTTTFSDLMVARFDIPLMSAEIFHYVAPQPLTASAIGTQLTQTLGCQQGLPTAALPFRTSDPNINIQNLATRDFAAGTAAVHPDYPGRLQLAYKALNAGLDQWTLMFQTGGNDVLIPVRPINQMLNLEMESDNITTFEGPNLLTPAEAFPINSAKPLQFSWAVTNTLLDPSYLTVQIGSPDSPNAVYCVFNANLGNSTIDSSYLQNLDDGQQDILVKLVTNQLWVKNGWLFGINDWRSGRISK